MPQNCRMVERPLSASHQRCHVLGLVRTLYHAERRLSSILGVPAFLGSRFHGSGDSEVEERRSDVRGEIGVPKHISSEAAMAERVP